MKSSAFTRANNKSMLMMILKKNAELLNSYYCKFAALLKISADGQLGSLFAISRAGRLRKPADVHFFAPQSLHHSLWFS
jgi:hypothetical protein